MAKKSEQISDFPVIGAIDGSESVPLVKNGINWRITIRAISSLGGPQGATGPAGPAGPDGPAGPTGPTGPAGSGSGDVVGPASAVDGTPMVADGTTGKLIKNITYAAFKTLLALVKGDVGLGNVDNTADTAKPVSTAQQTALNLKADLASPTFAGTPAAPTASGGTNTTQVATTAFVTAAVAALSTVYQAISTALGQIAALAPSNDDFLQRKAGAWVNRTVAQVKTDLGLTGTNSGDQTITLTGDLTGSGTGSFAATIANAAVTLAKMANMATGSLFYRKTAGSGAPEVQTLATLKTDLGLTGANSGDQTITLTGDITGTGTGSFAASIAAAAVTLAKMANMATASLIYRRTAGTGAPEVNTLAQLKTDLALAVADVSGAAPLASTLHSLLGGM